MKILGNFDREKIEKVLEIKYKYISYDIFKFLCANETERKKESCAMVFAELYEFFESKSQNVTVGAKCDILKKATDEYNRENDSGKKRIEKMLDSYLLNYPYKKHLLK